MRTLTVANLMISTQRSALAAGAALMLMASSAPVIAQPQTAPQNVDAASTTQTAQNVPLVPSKPTWDSFQGQLNGQKYSPLDQITAKNVHNLKKVWQFHTGDVSDGSGKVPATVWSATPIFANDTLYIGTPFYRVIALDPATGKVKWSFDTHTPLKAPTQPVLKNRGVAYWAADNPVPGMPCQKIVYMGTMDARLFALDADTSKKCAGFDDGVLNVNQWNTTHEKWPLSLLQPPTVVGDHLTLGWAGKDWAFEKASPGTVWSINARTGKREWTFDALCPEMQKDSGTANVWTQISADRKLGLVYLPISSPSPNFWGGNRTEKVPLATSTTALDINTGKVVWSRQWVHHDVWDYDINSAPTLMDITVDGKQIPALIQATKMGFLFVVNRKTGKDVWPIVERPVPGGDGSVMGEKLSPTQPFPSDPKPLLDQSKKPAVWGLADVGGAGQCSRLWSKLEYRGMYTLPTTRGEGAMEFPDSAGAVQWGGV